MREFAEQEITLPTGPFKNLRFRCDRQPFAGFILDEFDRLDEHGRPRWSTRAVTGPAQDGKTLVAFALPIGYHLFEMKEDVILGAPTMEMARDKWRRDILPIIRASRYAELLPKSGAGSRGGEFEAITFNHGPELKLMSAKGGDEKRSGYTARVIVMTEIDKMDEAATTSREADPVSQMKARAGAFGERAVFYEECTISHKKGRISQDITNGSDSRLALRCPHCAGHTVLEREHLTGWREATTEIQAFEQSAYCCGLCGTVWTEAQRVAANRNARLVHKGQEITADGQVTGPAPSTRTFGFRWNAANSMLKTAGSVGVEEWHAQRNPNSESGERFMCQFRWAIPYEDELLEHLSLSVAQIMRRVRPALPRGIVPADARVTAVGTDINKFRLHWVAMCLDAQSRPHVFDYGVQATSAAQIGTDEALKIALHELYDLFEAGWESEDGGHWTPDQVLIDARWKSKEVVYPFVLQKQNPRYLPAMGFGAGQMKRQGQINVYHAPTKKTAAVREIGNGYHRATMRQPRVDVLHVDVNLYKSFVYERLAIPLVDELGRAIDPLPDHAMTLFAPPPEQPNLHLDYGKHITAEEYVMKFVEGKGLTGVWDELSANNHLFDASMLASVGATRALALMNQPQVITNYFAQQQRAGRR